MDNSDKNTFRSELGGLYTANARKVASALHYIRAMTPIAVNSVEIPSIIHSFLPET